ncbi:hypothetical protein LWC34_54215 [Kibdelosporangium philippinense]|uniref:Uncharacterized protein n=1 Tax=Kibdelosporangium philippinense TaxID=211113 RepID=A0ABS8ZVJ7_9PSEU|nr:hypothetical protein [Kibdelosporangium philippinense]MCE7011714.1 hypothetical protein [Kibdelosporangium philippinense]
MFVYGVSFSDVQSVVRDVSDSLYDGNLTVRTGADRSNRAGPRATFTLRTLDSAGTGAKGSASWSGSGTGPKGRRRTISACWHAHYDVLAELFARFPHARVVTAIATYTAPTFHDRALATASLNVGCQLWPVTAPECCECDHSAYTYRVDSPDYMPSVDAMRPNSDVEYFLDQLDRVLAENTSRDSELVS